MTSADKLSEGVLAAFSAIAAYAPERPAVLSGNRTLSYGALRSSVARLARALLEDGVRAGDRVALILDNSPDFVVTYLAVLSSGAVAVALNPRSPVAAIARVFQDCQPVAAFTTRALAGALGDIGSTAGLAHVYVSGAGLAERLSKITDDESLPFPSQEALALIVYTSGTTGVPKGVMLSHANMREIARAGQSLVQLRENERIAALMPLFHLYGLREVDLALSAGATLVVPRDANFAAAVLSELKAAHVTGLSTVPSALAILLERYREELKTCLTDARYVTIGTAPLPSRLLAILRETLPRTRLVTTYGLTEASRVCWVDVTDASKPVDPRVVGRPYPGTQIFLVDEADGIGRVALKSSLIMQGYWQNPDATRATLMPDGTLLTPDSGRIDADGALHLLGRSDDIINCGGQKVSPVEIEEAIASHSMIESVTVLGIADPDGILGQVAQAVIVMKPGSTLSATEIKEHAAAKLEPHKVPRYVEFVKEIPKSILGKAQRSVMRL